MKEDIEDNKRESSGSSSNTTFEEIDLHSEEKEVNESGFGSNFTTSDVRLMNPNGSLNVRVKGIDRFKRFNVYKQLVKLSTLKFYLTFLTAYLVINAIFATIFYFQGINSFSLSADGFSWFDAFFFSNQTFTTVGYGHISPNSLGSNIVASSEAFVGLMYFAIATGLVYGRFSNSKADIRFSKNLLFSELGGDDVIMVRIANVSAVELSDIKAEVIMSFIEHTDDQRLLRRYRSLKLDQTHINLLTTSWTLVHRIKDDSPCLILDNDKSYTGLEFMIFITAFDEIFDQNVKIRTSYIEKDLVHNAKFVPITEYDSQTAVVDLDKLSAYYTI